MSSTSSNNKSTLLLLGGAAAAAVSLLLLYKKTTNKTTTKGNRKIYLDYNGTTPVYSEVFFVMVPYFLQHYGNPSSSHYMGHVPRHAIDTSRKQILQYLLGCDSVMMTMTFLLYGSQVVVQKLITLQYNWRYKVLPVITETDNNKNDDDIL